MFVEKDYNQGFQASRHCLMLSYDLDLILCVLHSSTQMNESFLCSVF